MTGLVASGFGLSAFLFSTIAHVAFPGNTSDFLLILALGTSVTPLLATFFLRHAPDEEPKPFDGSISAAPAAWETFDYDDESSETSRSRQATEAEMPLLSDARSPPRRARDLSSTTTPPTRLRPTRLESILMSVSPERRHDRSVTEELHFAAENLANVPPEPPVTPHDPHLHSPNEMHGLALFRTGDFWLIFSILLLRTLSNSS